MTERVSNWQSLESNSLMLLEALLLTPSLYCLTLGSSLRMSVFLKIINFYWPHLKNSLRCADHVQQMSHMATGQVVCLVLGFTVTGD